MSHATNRIGGGTRLTLTLLAAQAWAGCASLDQVSYEPPSLIARRPAPSVSTDRLRFLEQNVGMLPAPFGANNVDRAERICDRLTSYEPADVIVLLEVFDEAARAVFVRRLRDRWPWVIRRAGGGSLLPEDSGILLVSRFPIVSDGSPRIAFHSFREKGPITRADHWAAKGVLGAEIDLGAGRSLCILATHLMADYEVIGQYEHVRRRQLQEIVTFGREFVAGVPAGRRSSVVLVGDLNVPAERVVPDGGAFASRLVPTAEYQGMLALLQQPIDLYRASHGDETGWTWNHDPRAPGADPALGRWRLDYVLHLTGFVARERTDDLAFVRTSLMGHAPGVADHLGLVLDMDLTRPARDVVARPTVVARAPAPTPAPAVQETRPEVPEAALALATPPSSPGRTGLDG